MDLIRYTPWNEVYTIDSDPDAVAELVNVKTKHLGTRVAKTTDGRGYGLFATRAFRPGDRVATYGGGRVYKSTDEVNAAHAGLPWDSPYRDYVVQVTGSLFMDTGLFFRPQDAGRYVNESALGQNWAANVEGKYKKSTVDERTIDYWFQAKRPIEAGEEIIAYYGPQYGISKYGTRGPPWRWYNREATPELVAQMTAAANQLQSRLAKRGVVSAMESSDLRAARSQRDTKERELLEKRSVECQLCGKLAQHEEAYGMHRMFCNLDCQMEFYQRRKK